MNQVIVGAQIAEPSARDTVETIIRAEGFGVPAIWLTGGGSDPLISFAGAAIGTNSIKFGTSIVPTFPRHPLALAQQAAALAQLAPGRFRLGVGPSHRPTIEKTWGLAFEQPLGHLREYVGVLRAALTTGEVNVDGPRFKVHARIANPPQVPILVSALRQASFRLAGEIADGAITWVCPAPYLARVAVPAIQEGARKAGRPAPPLIAQCFVVLEENLEAVKAIAQQRLGAYPRLPFYAAMFEAAGFAEAKSGTLSQRMIEALVVHGDERQMADGLRAFAAAGATEIIASILPVGEDRRASIDRALKAIGGLAATASP
jgi:F420-dependent oxidoreductase-like protein